MSSFLQFAARSMVKGEMVRRGVFEVCHHFLFAAESVSKKWNNSLRCFSLLSSFLQFAASVVFVECVSLFFVDFTAGTVMKR